MWLACFIEVNQAVIGFTQTLKTRGQRKILSKHILCKTLRIPYIREFDLIVNRK